MRTHLGKTFSALILLLAASCGAAPATSEKAAQVERRLVAPYLQGRTVACNELVVEVTPNFHRHVSNPGVDPKRQRFERIERTAQVDKIWTNLRGDEAGWFTVTISEPVDPTDVRAQLGPRTTFKVMNQFTLRVRERGRMALDCQASGPILIVQEPQREPRNVRSFSITDGNVQSR